MKCEREGCERTLHVSELPVKIKGFENCYVGLDIEIRYAGDSSALKALPLDHVIIPRIVAALNHDEATEDEIIQARDLHQGDCCMIDDGAAVSRGRNNPSGCWVAAWVWISKEEPPATRDE
jgi:hypothetical protein